MIKAVLWDIDGTLLNFLAAEKNAIRKCFSIFGLGECTDSMIEEYSEINKKYWYLLETGQISKQDMLVARFRDFFALHDLDTDKAVPFNREYQLRLADTIVFCDGAQEVLSELKGNVIQCAASNGTKTAQTGKLAASGMDRIFDHIFISEDIGYEKPYKGFFDAVFKKLSPVKASEIMIVGDSTTSDIRGGCDSGLVTCWYNPSGLPLPAGLRADHIIKDLREVPLLISLYK